MSLKERIYQVLSESSTLNSNRSFYIYHSSEVLRRRLQTKQVNELTRLYRSHSSHHLCATIIIRCILSDVMQQSLTLRDGLQLLDQLTFCTQRLFEQCLSELLLDSVKATTSHSQSEMAPHTDKHRSNACKLMGSVYVAAVQNDSYCFLHLYANYCCEKLTAWTTNLDSVESILDDEHEQGFFLLIFCLNL